MRVVAIALVSAALAWGQARGGGGTPRPSTGGGVLAGQPGARPNSPGMLYDTNELIVHGRVALADGSAPQQFVMVERSCKGVMQNGGFADSKGRFSFNLGALNRAFLGGSGSVVDAEGTNQLAANRIKPEDLNGCEIRATLAGYRSESVQLSSGTVLQNGDLSTITLKPFAGEERGMRSPSDADAPKNAMKAFDKGMDAAAKAKWADALESLEKATQQYLAFSSAWLGLGLLQEGTGNYQAALASYRQAIKADPSFAAPYVQCGVVGSALNQWDAVAADTAKAIELAPRSYPRAYLLNAYASLKLRKPDEAARSATAGLSVDQERRFPELDYVLGMALVAKNESAAAREHFERYLAAAPKGPSAASARQQLTHLQSAR